MTKQIKKIVEQGPPEELMSQFEKYFGDKEQATLKLTQELADLLAFD